MTTIDGSPHGMTEDGAVYMLCRLFKANPALRQTGDIVIHPNGNIEIEALGERGVLRDWCRAIPQHKARTALVATSYGCDEADVIEGDHITVTVRRPLVGPGGVA